MQYVNGKKTLTADCHFIRCLNHLCLSSALFAYWWCRSDLLVDFFFRNFYWAICSFFWIFYKMVDRFCLFLLKCFHIEYWSQNKLKAKICSMDTTNVIRTTFIVRIASILHKPGYNGSWFAIIWCESID